MRLFILILGGFMSACGTSDDVPGPAVAQEGALLVQDIGSLPTCDADGEGRLAYVKAEETFKACAAGAWGNIDIKGPKGDKGDSGVAGVAGVNGATGADGATGAAGADGVSLTVAEQWTCDPSGDLDDVANKETMSVRTNVVKFSSGDYLISCMDRRVDFDFAFSDSSANSAILSSKSAGATSTPPIVSCVSFYTFAIFSPLGGSVAYGPNGGVAKEVVQCTKLSAP